VILGTRGSQLALFQAHAVATLLHERTGRACEIAVIKTSGDRLADATLAQIGGKRLFVKEIEDALLQGAIDLAVHSSKDMPAQLPDGLVIGAVLPREDPRDAVVLPAYVGRVPRGETSDQAPPSGPADGDARLDEIIHRLGDTPRIGTSSVRRTAQLSMLLPTARFGPIRGNLDTRLRRLDAGEFDALVLAAAGLRRLGHGSRISAALPPGACVPAPGQGIIAVEIRSDNANMRGIVDTIGDRVAASALAAERTVVTRLGGGCQMPIGAYAAVSGGNLSLSAIVLSLDGRRSARAEASGPLADAERIGTRAADRLLAEGAADILAGVERARAAVDGLQP